MKERCRIECDTNGIYRVIHMESSGENNWETVVYTSTERNEAGYNEVKKWMEENL